MKIKTIEVKNFKAISEQTANFDGCSAIITAGNNQGKTSLLRGLIDRFRSEKPEIILKEGESKGFNIVELTDGSKIEWNFTDKSEKFAFILKDGIKQTTSVLKSIGEKYFGIEFDIDKFLNASPKNQSKELQRLVGLDFTEIDERYQNAYDERTFLNRQFTEISAQKKVAPIEENHRDIDEIKKEITAIKKSNSEKLDTWDDENSIERKKIELLNEIQRANARQLNECENAYKEIIKNVDILQGFGLVFRNEIDVLFNFIESLEKPKEQRNFEPAERPQPESTEVLEIELEDSQRYFHEFEAKKTTYKKWIENGKVARKNKEIADEKVKEIQVEKNELIKNAELPAEFSFSDTGILYNDLPLSSNQISSSTRYIAGLKLGFMVLGKIKTMHFDASFLDKNSLAEVQEWAIENDLQLLIERPDFDGGEIKYEII